MRFNGKPHLNLHICKEEALGMIAGGFFFWSVCMNFKRNNHYITNGTKTAPD